MVDITMKKLQGLLVLVLNVSLLFACQQKTGHAISDTASEQAASGAPLKSLKHAKPGAPISLVSPGQWVVAPGSVTSIDILLSAQLDGGTMHVELKPSEGLQLSDQREIYDFTPSEDGQYKIKADVHAASNGRYYLNVNATISTAESSQFRSLAIIVAVGADLEAAEQSSKVRKNVADENIISLPTQEQIINR